MIQKLLSEGYEVLGLTSDLEKAKTTFSNELNYKLTISSFDFLSPNIILSVLEDYMPDKVFNFAAKATGQGMFDFPYLVTRLNGVFVLEILEAIRTLKDSKDIVLVQASSSELFGKVLESPQNETTLGAPTSPYGVAKLFAHQMLSVYREIYGVRCSAAILYNHESERRSRDFVTAKIAFTAVQIKKGLQKELLLGSLEAKRDWGFAPEYVEAMYMMSNQCLMKDFIVATGKLTTVGSLCSAAFSHLDLDYNDYVKGDADNFRRAHSFNLLGDPSRIENELGWRHEMSSLDVIRLMVDHEMKLASS